MSIDFVELRGLRDSLVESLVKWGNGEFFRSSPRSSVGRSFTNTGMVLQAFKEAGSIHLAHDLAGRMVSYLGSTTQGLFPQEKCREDSEVHVLCNSWPAFAILDTYPNRVGELSLICEWLVETQREDGSWALVPGEETSESMVTAYAISALQQFLRCFLQLQELPSRSGPRREVGNIETAIEKGVAHLLERRSRVARERDLYLWSAAGRKRGSERLSLGTSALCLHVLEKWGRYSSRVELRENAQKTFRDLLKDFDAPVSSSLKLGRARLAFWDEILFNEGRMNYTWSFFTPISIVTLLRFVEGQGGTLTQGERRFVVGFLKWIQENIEELDGGTAGVRGGETIMAPKVWSTAQSVIVLSRVIERQTILEGLLADSTSTSRAQGVVEDGGMRLAIELANTMKEPISRGALLVLGATILLLALGGLTFLFLPLLKPESWSRWEGYIFWAGQVVLPLFLSAVGLSLSVVRKGVFALARKIILLTRGIKNIGAMVRLLEGSCQKSPD